MQPKQNLFVRHLIPSNGSLGDEAGHTASEQDGSKTLRTPLDSPGTGRVQNQNHVCGPGPGEGRARGR
jgi:hypothetical protein